MNKWVPPGPAVLAGQGVPRVGMRCGRWGCPWRGARPAVGSGAGAVRELPQPLLAACGTGSCPASGDTGQGAPGQGGGGAQRRWVKVSKGWHRLVPPAQGGRTWCPLAGTSSSLWSACGRLRHPQGGGDVVTHPSGARPPAGTLSQGCVPMPCPSLPASPTLSPALSTWHTWARGAGAIPLLYGEQRAGGGLAGRCHLPPSLPPPGDAGLGLCPRCAPRQGGIACASAASGHVPSVPGHRAGPWQPARPLPGARSLVPGEAGCHAGAR